MLISNFDELLEAARSQREPQRLLFVFAGVELPEGSTPEEAAGFAAGDGGALVPLMCVDKAPSELHSFKALADESILLGQNWTIVFAAAMSGTDGNHPSSEDAELPLQRMVEAIRQGALEAFIPFDRLGQPVVFC